MPLEREFLKVMKKLHHNCDINCNAIFFIDVITNVLEIFLEQLLKYPKRAPNGDKEEKEVSYPQTMFILNQIFCEMVIMLALLLYNVPFLPMLVQYRPKCFLPIFCCCSFGVKQIYI